MTLRLATKGWKAAADAFIDEVVRSGEFIVHGGEDTSWSFPYPREERRKLVTRVIFLLNIMKIGDHACHYAVNLIVVDIPEGITSISMFAFRSCRSLTTVSFPTTLTSIGCASFAGCSSLDNLDLLHTNLQELGAMAFAHCTELKSVMIPDSLQTLDTNVFYACSKLVPSNIDLDHGHDVSAVVAHLRLKQNQT